MGATLLRRHDTLVASPLGLRLTTCRLRGAGVNVVHVLVFVDVSVGEDILFLQILFLRGTAVST